MGVCSSYRPGKLRDVASITWGTEIAEVYDATSAAMFDPLVLEPTVELLAALAAGQARC